APAPVPDLADVRGQSTAKRALLIAAAGGHHLLFIGAPGVGKSLLAQRLPGLLPPLGLEEQREVAAIHALRGDAPARAGMRPPFRAPHHTASAYAMVGGGPRAVPGEISLAHRGVLFLDELPEFSRNVLEALREPLETGEVNVVRTAMQARYPAEFQLVAAMNPCPCGQLGQGECDCSPARLQHYRARLSGPLLDRIDLRLHVHRVGAALWKAPAVAGSETSAAMAERVRAAREIQRARQGCLNARLGVATTMSACALTPGAQRSLERGTKRFELSARVAHRMARIARTIADLEAAPVVTEAAVAEALTLRFD
ncbi:MAG: ATP-binding protein, partial [Steroidobacteraceae bacterium]